MLFAKSCTFPKHPKVGNIMQKKRTFERSNGKNRGYLLKVKTHTAERNTQGGAEDKASSQK